MNSKIKNLLSLAFTGGYAVNLKAFNARYKPHNTLSKCKHEIQNKKSAFPCIYRRLCGKSQSI
jgi:hypothetical protein